jgi:integrase
MLALEIPYVLKRGRGYRYRRIVPPDVRNAINRKNWIKSWRAGTPLAVVEREARHLAAKHDNEIAAARGEELSPAQVEQVEAKARDWLAGDLSDLHGFLAMLAEHREDFGELPPDIEAVARAIEGGGRYLPESLPLTAALARDAERYGQDRDPRPFTQALGSFVAVIGDKEVTAITRADVGEWIQSMDNLKPVTVRRRVGCLRAMVNRLFLDLDLDRRNPFERHTVKDGQGLASDRLPFNTAMLDLIDAYLSSNQRLGHETRNIMRLLKGTGAGPGEVGGLVLADVILDSEVPYIWIRPNALRGVKAAVRDRQVPLVDEALEAANDAYRRTTARAEGKSHDHAAMFESFGEGIKAADSISAKLSKAIRAAGVPKSPRLTAYSFRHTVKEAMRSAGVVDHVQRRLLGHSGQGVADRYGSPRGRLNEAREALERALEHLGDVDPAIYSEQERIK